MKSIVPSSRWIGGLLIVMTLLFLNGCAGRSTPPPNPVPSQAQTGGTASTPTSAQSLSYGFPDIPVPRELDLQPDDSYVYQEGKIKAGVITLKGRVEIGSLITFFQTAMPRQGWTSKGGFRYRRSVLAFEKPGKTCVISMYETLFYTYVEIYVIPANGKA